MLPILHFNFRSLILAIYQRLCRSSVANDDGSTIEQTVIQYRNKKSTSSVEQVQERQVKLFQFFKKSHLKQQANTKTTAGCLTSSVTSSALPGNTERNHVHRFCFSPNYNILSHQINKLRLRTIKLKERWRAGNVSYTPV